MNLNSRVPKFESCQKFLTSKLSVSGAIQIQRQKISAMLTEPRGKYCAELQAQCHVKTGTDSSELDRTRTKQPRMEFYLDRTQELF
ncbi:hypothetical protein JOB18_029681 [Solea senegalensis]|uniref:Uncharacterized protein n=1 Tax=Solea senegalensis TaxID=28829 RepID=A0AAV6SVB7_SOLSE|nr:hypothetical protein JOB18_029681 [Solea senegalensis]